GWRRSSVPSRRLYVSPVASYRRLFALTGPVYVLIAFLGRLPLAMSQLGSMLLVSGVTGSYGAGGATAGALAVANAIGSPLAGALTDRVGQRPVLLVQSVVASVGLLWLVLLAGAYQPGQPWWPLLVIATIVGAFTPQVGTMARVRWRPISRRAGMERRDVVDAAFSYEGAADEASFVLGPALVGVVAALLNPGAALVAAGVLLAAFGTWFAVHPTADLVGRPPTRTQVTSRLFTPSLLLLAAVQLSVGTIFG